MKKYNTVQTLLRNIETTKKLSSKPDHLFTFEGRVYNFPQKFKLDEILVTTEVKEGRINKGKEAEPYKISFTIQTPKSHKQDFEGSPLLYEKVEIKALYWLYKTYFANIETRIIEEAKDLKVLQTKAITLKHKFRDYAELALEL